MSDIKKTLMGLAEVQSTMLITDESRSKIIRAINEIKKLQAENAELRKQSEWIDKKVSPVNFHSDWEDGEKALAINFNSEKPYAFEIERDDDLWCSIGGEEFTHWMPLPCSPL